VHVYKNNKATFTKVESAREKMKRETIKEIEEALDETAEQFIKGFNKVQRLIKTIKNEK